MDLQLELAQKPFIELQIEALTGENRIKPKRVNKFIDELEAKILELDKLDHDKVLRRTLRLPLTGRPNSLNADYPKCFKFTTPEKLDVIGGFRTSTAIERTKYVDLAICISAKCFEKKDIKNQRYHHKRALYLAQLAHLLKVSSSSDIISSLEFKYHQGDFLKPVLLIVPTDAKLKNVTFQLFAYPHNDCPIKISQLHPSHGNIAPKWFFKNYDLSNSDAAVQEFILSDSDVCPSPFYNSSILFDIELVENSDVLFEQLGTHSSLVEALMLTKIWLLQRELHQHFSFIISLYIASLQVRQAVHQNMSSYQIFKVIIKSIADSKWDQDGFSYYEDSANKISSFKPYFPVVFLSPSGNLNLCYNTTADIYERLKHEAGLSQIILSKNCQNTFELLFLKRIEFMNKYDVLVHLPNCTKKLQSKLENLKKFMDHGVFTPRVYSDRILNLIRKSLTDRVVLVQQSTDHLTFDKKWKLRSIPYNPSNENHTFSFGLLLEPEKSLRIIDIGPEAQTPEAEEFRSFWEPKSQLRLQNGVISETVVWHVDSFSKRRAIIKYILVHALKRLDIRNVIVHYTLLERFISLQNVYFGWRNESSDQVITNGNSLKRKHEDTESSVPVGVGEEIFQKILHGYNELNKILRNVENLKHSITSIQSVSHHLRSSSIFPPLPVCLQKRNKSIKRKKGVSLLPENFDEIGKILYIEPIEILISLDSGGKWPNDFEALEAAKIEYLIELGEALQEKEYTVKFAENYLDVLHGQFVYRLRAKCPKELSLVATACGKQEFQRRRLEQEILPRLHSSLDQLYREKTSFGLTCRLIKRWLACHLMSDHMSDITIDLLVAHLYLHPEPYTEPSSSSCGFNRFLMLLSQHDWKTSPLIVNFDDQLKIDEVNKLTASMAEDRSKYPPIVICTPYDKDTSPWTRLEPTQDKFDLLIKMCSKAYEFYRKEILYNFEMSEECKALFRPNFKLFNLLIKLHPSVVQNFFMRIDVPQNLRLSGDEPSTKTVSALKVMPIVGLNAIEEYVKSLQDKYGDIACFFYDKYGQRLIGVVLKPRAKEVLQGNWKKLIAGIKELGSKLVEGVKIVKQEM